MDNGGIKKPHISVGFRWFHGTFDNTSYFTFPVNAYRHGRNLILDNEYFSILRSKKKQKMETAGERKLRFLHLVNKHNFTRANLGIELPILYMRTLCLAWDRLL